MWATLIGAQCSEQGRWGVFGKGSPYFWCLSVNSVVSSTPPFDKESDSLWQKQRRGGELQMRDVGASDNTMSEPRISRETQNVVRVGGVSLVDVVWKARIWIVQKGRCLLKTQRPFPTKNYLERVRVGWSPGSSLSLEGWWVNWVTSEGFSGPKYELETPHPPPLLERNWKPSWASPPTKHSAPNGAFLLEFSF